MDHNYAEMAGLPWSLTKKLLFRFFFLFFGLFMFFTPNGAIPLADDIAGWYSKPFHIFIPWVGKHILHLSYPITSFTNGSGDTTYDWLLLLFCILVAMLGCMVWTVADRRRRNYKVLYYWFTVAIRYYCAYNMFSYGMAKIYKLQFPFPSPGALLEPFGMYSPMHVAWAFFGYSKGYNYVTGLAEVISGALLLFRRTTRLGAVFLLVVMVNIMAVNYCFDVCVKLLSTILAIMALFLLLQERGRLLDFFFRNRFAAPESEWAPRFRRRWINISLLVVKYGFTLVVLITIYTTVMKYWPGYNDDRPKSALYGIFNVQSFVQNKDTLAPLLTDTVRWRRLVINEQDGASYLSVRQMNDSAKAFQLKADSVTGAFTVFTSTDTLTKYHLTYSFIGNHKDSLWLRGNFKGNSLSVVLQKFPMDNFILVSRGFHLINEGPFQR